MQNNKLAVLVGVAAVALVAVLGYVYLDKQKAGQAAPDAPEVYSFSGKIKSAQSGTLVIETYLIVPDPDGVNPPRVETIDRTVKVNGSTDVFKKEATEGGLVSKDLKLADLAPGQDVVVYTEEQPKDGQDVRATQIERTN